MEGFRNLWYLLLHGEVIVVRLGVVLFPVARQQVVPSPGIRNHWHVQHLQTGHRLDATVCISEFQRILRFPEAHTSL